MKKYVIVGAGSRGLEMYAKPIATELKKYAELVGVYDVNSVRANLLSRECGNIPVYSDFNLMLDKANPDAVIITTIDKFHHEYIIKALEAGYDVISEKPMTIDAEKTKSILDTEKRTGKKVEVTFNVRFMPYPSRIKELILEGIVGEVFNVDFEWYLDTSHGADYYRRWHRYLENSGGLLVHKSTHHFDMINWWIGQVPEELYAFGTRRFYGSIRDERGERCLTCEHKSKCEFYIDITNNESLRKLYFDAEKEDGYHRDGCVFSESINIYDTMSVNLKYSSGALLTYSLISHSPYEGWRATINGSKGRLEIGENYSGQQSKEPCNIIRLYNRKGEFITYNVPREEGIHGGGDVRLRRMIFVGDVEDTIGQLADSRAGAMSLLIGAGANISIKEKRPVMIDELLR